jgi:hypothetical protein
LALLLAASPAWPAPDAGVSSEGSTPHPAFARFEAAGGVGWAHDDAEVGWRRFNQARGEVSYLDTPGLVLGLHGLYEDAERSFVATAPVDLSAGTTRVVARERRVDVGLSVGWDPMKCWPDPRQRRAGVMLEVMKLDLDQFMNRFAPLIGFEPGAGLRGYVRMVGPLTASAGGSYQWVTNFSDDAVTLRAVRGRPLGALRYDVKLALRLVRFGTLDARYAGESFEYMHDRTRTHALLLGATLDV